MVDKSPKQVIVLRKDLNMTKGKMVAQGSHASLDVILSLMNGGEPLKNKPPIIEDGKYTLKLEVEIGSCLDNWLRGMYTKICVGTQGEEELITIYEQAVAMGLPATLITDSGLTMFHGVKTKTAVAIGPASCDDIDLITGHLKLL